MRLLELAHVDGDDVLLAAVERLGQRQRGFRLADARGAAKHEDTDRLVGVRKARAAGLDPLGDGLKAVILSDHAFLQAVGEGQHGL